MNLKLKDIKKNIAELKEQQDSLAKFKEDYRMMIKEISRDMLIAMYGCPITKKIELDIKEWVDEQ